MGGKRYTNTDKEQAFRIYFETGSISETTRRMKKFLPHISKATVSGWSKEKDGRGLDWLARRQEIQAASNKGLDKQLASDRKEILGNAQAFRERILAQLPVLEAKTLEGATFAFTSLSKFILEQSGADRDSQQTAREATTALILALKDDPEIADILERKWPEIEKRFFTHLERVQKQAAK